MNSRIVFDVSFDLISMFVIESLQEKTTFYLFSQTLLPLLLSLQWYKNATYGGF